MRREKLEAIKQALSGGEKLYISKGIWTLEIDEIIHIGNKEIARGIVCLSQDREIEIGQTAGHTLRSQDIDDLYEAVKI